MKNYYNILGVEKDATLEEIKTAYKYLAKKFHPDMNPGDLKSKRYFQEIQEAYECLSDKSKRQAYDAVYNTNNQKQYSENSYSNAERQEWEKQYQEYTGRIAESKAYIKKIQIKYLEVTVGISIGLVILLGLKYDNAFSEGYVFIAPAIFIVLYLYSLPTIFAYRSNHPYKAEIFLLNIFCFIPAIFPFGWILLLIFSFNRIKGVNAIFLALIALFAQHSTNKENRNNWT